MKNTNSVSTYKDNAVMIELTDEDLTEVTGGNGAKDYYDNNDHDHDHNRHDHHRCDHRHNGYRY